MILKIVILIMLVGVCASPLLILMIWSQTINIILYMIFGFALTAFLVGTIIFSAVESQIYDKLFGSVSVKTDDEKSEILQVNY